MPAHIFHIGAGSFARPPQLAFSHEAVQRAMADVVEAMTTLQMQAQLAGVGREFTEALAAGRWCELMVTSAVTQIASHQDERGSRG